MVAAEEEKSSRLVLVGRIHRAHQGGKPPTAMSRARLHQRVPRRLARSVVAHARRLFAVTRVFSRFEGGACVGITKVNSTVRVAPDGETFAAVSLSELRDPAGNVIRSGLPGTAVGSRMHLERIPNQPHRTRRRVVGAVIQSSPPPLPELPPPSPPERPGHDRAPCPSCPRFRPRFRFQSSSCARSPSSRRSCRRGALGHRGERDGARDHRDCRQQGKLESVRSSTP